MIKYLVAIICAVLVLVASFRMQGLEPEFNEYACFMGVILSLAFMAVVAKIDDWWTSKYSYILDINYVQACIISRMLNKYIAPTVEKEDKDKKVMAILVDWDEKSKDALVVFSSENCDSYVPLKEVTDQNIVKAIGNLEDQEWDYKTKKTQKKWTDEEGDY